MTALQPVESALELSGVNYSYRCNEAWLLGAVAAGYLLRTQLPDALDLENLRAA